MSKRNADSKPGAVSYTTRSSFLRDICAGSEAAWYEFYRKYSGMIRYIGQKRQLTADECDDLLVDVMTIFWKRIDNFIYEPERGKFRSYLGRISDNAALKILRKKNRDLIPVDIAELVYPEGIDVPFMDEWRNFVLENALNELKGSVDTATYQVFYMVFFQNRPVKDIVAMTGKSVNGVYTIKSRCLKKLKSLITVYRQKEAEFLSSCHSQRNASEY